MKKRHFVREVVVRRFREVRRWPVPRRAITQREWLVVRVLDDRLVSGFGRHGDEEDKLSSDSVEYGVEGRILLEPLQLTFWPRFVIVPLAGGRPLRPGL